MTAQPTDRDLPFVVRIAGLPADAIEPFGGRLLDRLDGLEKLERKIKSAWSELVDALFADIHGAEPAIRRRLLALKRDAFNGRSLASPGIDLEPSTDRILHRVLELEHRLGRLRDELATAYEAERLSEAKALLESLEDSRFLRGVALSGSEFIDRLGALKTCPPQDFSHRQERLMAGLLSYRLRAALKPSPFSTLGLVGFGSIEDGAGGLRLLPTETWQERSVVHLARHLVQELGHLLTHHRSIATHMKLAVNRTVQEKDGVFRFIREGRYVRESESPARWIQPALVHARLGGELVGRLLRHADREWTRRDLLVHLCEHLPSRTPDSLEKTVQTLYDIGFLRVPWPWSEAESRAEERLVELVEELPTDMDPPAADVVSRVARTLERFLDLQRSYADSPTPVEELGRFKASYRSMRRALSPGARPETRSRHSDRRFLSEDVYVHGPDTPVASLPRQTLDAVRQALDPLAALSRILGGRPALHALAGLHTQFPSSRVPFLDFYHHALAPFQSYVKYARASTPEERFQRDDPAFNPFELAAVEDEHRLRKELLRNAARCVQPWHGQGRLDPAALARVVATYPWQAGDSAGDYSAFLQPLDSAGEQWVLNELGGGPARMSARFVAAMDADAREAVVSRMEARSLFHDGDGRQCEWVDVHCTAGHGTNVHPRLTPRVFDLLELPSGVARERRLKLTDVWVRFRGADRLPELVDGQGRRILPIHLGSVGSAYMPSVVKVLLLFGPPAFVQMLPGLDDSPEGEERSAESHPLGAVIMSRRCLSGGVVYRRQSWTLNTEPWPALLGSLTGARAFEVLNHGRRSVGVPRQVFYRLPPLAGLRTKPQYLDFSSPRLVEAFQRAVLGRRGKTVLYEALPEPGQLMSVGSERRAVELQIESLAGDRLPAQLNDD